MLAALRALYAIILVAGLALVILDPEPWHAAAFVGGIVGAATRSRKINNNL